VGQVRWKIFIHHAISATLPSTYENLLKFVEIRRSYDKNKNAHEVMTKIKMHSFFRHDV